MGILSEQCTLPGAWKWEKKKMRLAHVFDNSGLVFSCALRVFCVNKMPWSEHSDYYAWKGFQKAQNIVEIWDICAVNLSGMQSKLLSKVDARNTHLTR